jgi:hypothetical protein
MFFMAVQMDKLGTNSSPHEVGYAMQISSVTGVTDRPKA